jgi:hypothetical protein
MNTRTFLRTHPTQGEALVWLAMQRAEATPGAMTFLEAVDAVLLDARNAGIKTWQKLNERVDRGEAFEAQRKARAR